MNNYSDIELFATPNQHLLFCNIDEKLKESFEKDMKLFRYGFRKINDRNIITNGTTGMISKPYSK